VEFTVSEIRARGFGVAVFTFPLIPEGFVFGVLDFGDIEAKADPAGITDRGKGEGIVGGVMESAHYFRKEGRPLEFQVRMADLIDADIS
jgi:hypothetical protein